MSTASRGCLKFCVALGVLFLAEMLTFYGLSLCYLLESAPQNHDDPLLQWWAWVFVIAMPLELAVFLYWIIRGYSSGSSGLSPDNGKK
jgi:hypothetical protein